MTPKEYAEKYWNLEVYLVPPKVPSYPEILVHPAASVYFAKRSLAGIGDAVANAIDSAISDDHGVWFRTRVASYRLGPSYEDKNNDNKFDEKADHAYRDDLDNAAGGRKDIKIKVKRIDGTIETRSFGTYRDMMYAATTPFSGKGFPEEAQMALQLRYRYQKTTFTLAQFASMHFIGLDCNGFVGGYLRRRNDAANWFRKEPDPKTMIGPSMPIRALMGPEDKYYTSMSDFKPPGLKCLLFGMCTDNGYVLDNDGAGGVGHIMITEPNTMKKDGDQILVDVVESTALEDRGLTMDQYRIKGVKKGTKGVFEVTRYGTPLNVRIREVD